MIKEFFVKLFVMQDRREILLLWNFLRLPDTHDNKMQDLPSSQNQVDLWSDIHTPLTMLSFRNCAVALITVFCVE